MRFKMFLKPIFITICLILVSTANIFAQPNPADENVFPPPAEGLVAVHFPKMDGLEKEVREQIVSFQETLAKEAKGVSNETANNLSDAYGTLGQIYQAYTMFEPAKQCYTNASKIASQDFRWIYLHATILQEENKLYDSIEYFKKAGQLAPKYPATYVNLGNNYFELNLFSLAKNSFTEALKISPDNPAAIYGLGQIAYAEKNYQSAVTYFEKVLELLPGANRLHYSLALAYRGLKNTEKAKFHISKQGVVGVRPNDPLFDSLNELKQGVRLRLLRAKQALDAGRFAEAEIEYKKVLALEPENITALVNYGAVLIQFNKPGEAIRLFEKAVSTDPKNSNARFNLAALLSAQQKHFEAISHLKVVLENDPKDLNTRFFLAKELRNANLLKEAESELLSVYNADPDNETVLIEAVKFLNQKGDHKLAKTLLEKSHAKFPTRGRTLATLAFLLAASPKLELRDGKRALELSQSVYQATNLAEHGAIVAMSLAELGKCEEAAKLTQQLIEKTEKSNDPNLVIKLKNELKRYQTGKPCSLIIDH